MALAILEAGGSSRFLTVDKIPGDDVLDVGQECRFTPDHFYIGTFAIDISKVPLWSSPLQELERDLDGRYVLDKDSAARFLQLVREMDVRPGADAGVEIAPGTVGRWLGLGPGLTPSGDDLLLGYLAIDNEFGTSLEWTRKLHEAVFADLHRTTTLSAQLLRSAIARDYHENIGAMIAALAGQGSRPLEQCLRVLLSVGAHSGGDTATGMAMALVHLNKGHH